MPQIKLQNRTGRRVTDGELVRLFPGTTTAFIVANLNEFGIIGTVSGTIETGQVGVINLINTVDYSKLLGVPSTFPPSNYNHRIVTDSTTELATDHTIICNKATAMTVTLLTARGSGRVREISNIGAGDVTVDASGAETIDDELTQIVSQWETMVIKDYGTGLWKII